MQTYSIRWVFTTLLWRKIIPDQWNVWKKLSFWSQIMKTQGSSSTSWWLNQGKSCRLSLYFKGCSNSTHFLPIPTISWVWKHKTLGIIHKLGFSLKMQRDTTIFQQRTRTKRNLIILNWRRPWRRGGWKTEEAPLHTAETLAYLVLMVSLFGFT